MRKEREREGRRNGREEVEEGGGRVERRGKGGGVEGERERKLGNRRGEGEGREERPGFEFTILKVQIVTLNNVICQ